MENIKFNVAMLCAYLGGINTDQLADAAGIERNHMAAIRAGRATVTGEDIIGMSDATYSMAPALGKQPIEVRQIETSKERQ
ncbi:MAG: hypothetical protein LKE48_02545 [Solobacterium sp.]|jgi:hypothetical protein|nr:hypothetical protein [Solobacterium sp.]